MLSLPRDVDQSAHQSVSSRSSVITRQSHRRGRGNVNPTHRALLRRAVARPRGSVFSTKREQHGHELGGWRDCAGHDRAGRRAPMAPIPTGIILTVASKAGTGLFLADGSGRALYVLDKTPSDTNSWKPVSGASAPTTTDTSIKAGMIGTTTRRQRHAGDVRRQSRSTTTPVMRPRAT